MHLYRTLQQVKEIALDAGILVMNYFEKPVAMNAKANARDIVTEADKASEKLIVERLTALYPEHHIVGEEGGGQGKPMDEAEYYWYVDPIDGTTNFAGSIPYFSVSIAMTDKDFNPLLGVVLDPTRPELFAAIKGEGAWRNDQPIRVSSADKLVDSIVVSGFPTGDRLMNVPHWQNFLPHVRGARRLGSAALDLCYVACGRAEGFWENAINRWDVMAGVLMVQEAGGTLSDFDGNPDPQRIDSGQYLASNGLIHDTMLRVLQTGSPDA